MADNGVPEWGANLRALVGAQGATLIAIQTNINHIAATLEAHCQQKNSNGLKSMLALGTGIGIGMGSVGAGLLKVLGMV